MFDNGHLKDDIVSSQNMIDRLLFRLQLGNENEAMPGDPPLIQVVNSVWDRILKVRSILVGKLLIHMCTDII